MLPASAVSRVCGVNVEYRNFNAGAGGFLPQRLAVTGAGNSGVSYSVDKFEAAGSADEIGGRYGYGSPLHLAALQHFPAGGGGANVPVTFCPPAEEAQGAQAAGAVACDGAAAAAGSAAVIIGGVRAVFAVLNGDTGTVIPILY
jgi:phage tail sheath gpL-like